MRRLSKSNYVLPLLMLAMTFAAHSALACAACYGKSDSPLAQAMNWGIFSLLGVVVGVLGTIASFFVFLAKKSAAVTAAAAAHGDAAQDPTQKA